MADSPARSGGEGEAATHVGSADAFAETVATGTVLVDCYAEWCGPCKMMASTVDELAAESDATVVKVDVEEVPAVAATHDVQSVPAFVVFEDDPRLSLEYAEFTTGTAEGDWVYSRDYDCELDCD